jgi:hypothetical protein
MVCECCECSALRCDQDGTCVEYYLGIHRWWGDLLVVNWLTKFLYNSEWQEPEEYLMFLLLSSICQPFRNCILGSKKDVNLQVESSAQILLHVLFMHVTKYSRYELQLVRLATRESRNIWPQWCLPKATVYVSPKRAVYTETSVDWATCIYVLKKLKSAV